MKQFLLLFISSVLLTAVISCSQEEDEKPGPVAISLSSIDVGSFSKTDWQHVLGGEAYVEFKLKEESSYSNTIKDSIDLMKISAYSRTLAQGAYDISLTTKQNSAIADSVIRFESKLVDFKIGLSNKLSFVATTNDGLITLSKEFVEDNDVPVFKSVDSASSAFKLALINGFYYLYIKGGTSGTLSFSSAKTGQKLSKKVDIQSNNHYNLVLTIVNSSVDIKFEDFKYHDVPVTSNAIITVTQDPLQTNDDITYILADESGYILDIVNRAQGFKTIKLSSKVPTDKERFNVFRFTKYSDSQVLPSLTAYLHVKKGSVWNTAGPIYYGQAHTYPLNLKFRNVPEYTHFTFSTDLLGGTVSPAEGVRFFESNQYSFSDSSKVLVQVEKGDKAYYNFLDIKKGVHDYTVDASLAIKRCDRISINFPKNDGNGYIKVIGVTNRRSNQGYVFASRNFTGSSIYLFSPQEKFDQYDTYYMYQNNGRSYICSLRDNYVPAEPENFDVSYKITKSSLDGFNPFFTGKFDYYHAQFASKSNQLLVDVYAPSTGDHTKNVFPDVSGLAGFNNLNWDTFELLSMEMLQKSTFKEDRLNYVDAFTYPYKEKSMIGYTDFSRSFY